MEFSKLYEAKILIVERHIMFAEALEKRLNGSHKATVNICTDVTSAIDACDMATFDLVLTDFFLPSHWGVSAVSEVIKAAKGAPVVVLSEWIPNFAVLACKAAGCRDYVSKSTSLEVMLKSLDLALSGIWVSSNEEEKFEANQRLSVEEGWILSLYLEGREISDIAEALDRSEGSISAAIRSSYAKLEVKSKLEALNHLAVHFRSLLRPS